MGYNSKFKSCRNRACLLSHCRIMKQWAFIKSRNNIGSRQKGLRALMTWQAQCKSLPSPFILASHRMTTMLLRRSRLFILHCNILFPLIINGLLISSLRQGPTISLYQLNFYDILCILPMISHKYLLYSGVNLLIC